MAAPMSGKTDLRGKAGIVTGAAGGIGRAVCDALVREGAFVEALDISFPKASGHRLGNRGGSIYNLGCDVSSREEVQAAVIACKENFGRIDFLVNSAGILGRSGKDLSEYATQEWDEVLGVNLKGTFLMTQAVWPHMRSQGGGKIVCIGSIAGRIGGLLAGPHYRASKGGIHAFVKWAAKQGAPHGVYVNAIAPGPILTPMIANEPYNSDMIPLGRLGDPSDVAEAVIFLLSQASNFIIGQVLDVNGGMLMA